jgi:uncharacterized protein
MGYAESRRKAASDRLQLIRNKPGGPAQTGNRHPKFVADVMLGRLAKWLRIAGFDVLYSNQYSDNELIEISNREERVLLSRDIRLLLRKPVRNFLFIETQDIQSQLRQVFKSIQVHKLELPLTRCLSCNDILVETDRETVRECVPFYVYQTQSHFKICPQCRKIFWAGTHRDAVIRIVSCCLKPLKITDSAAGRLS